MALSRPKHGFESPRSAVSSLANARRSASFRFRDSSTPEPPRHARRRREVRQFALEFLQPLGEVCAPPGPLLLALVTPELGDG